MCNLCLSYAGRVIRQLKTYHASFSDSCIFCVHRGLEDDDNDYRDEFNDEDVSCLDKKF